MNKIIEHWEKITDKLISEGRSDAIIYILNKEYLDPIFFNKDMYLMKVEIVPEIKSLGKAIDAFNYNGFTIVYVKNELAEKEVIYYKYSEFKKLEL